MFEVTVKLRERLVTKFRGQGEMTIGRDPSCELMLDNLGVSRRHAQLREVGDRFVIEDLNSTNGVFVDSRRVTTAQVNPGEEIKIGKFVLTIQHAREEPAGEQIFDINQTIAIEGMALPMVERDEPRFVASIMRDVFHKIECNWIKATQESHKVFYATEGEALNDGKRPCKTCFPSTARF